jgi:hypothetical protein
VKVPNAMGYENGKVAGPGESIINNNIVKYILLPVRHENGKVAWAGEGDFEKRLDVLIGEHRQVNRDGDWWWRWSLGKDGW